MPPQAPVAKFGNNLIPSKPYMLVTQGKKQTSLKYTLESPLVDYSATTGPGGKKRT